MAIGYWPGYRYNPTRAVRGENPFTLDSRPPTLALAEFLATEDRFTTMLEATTSTQSPIVSADGAASALQTPHGELLELVSHYVAARWHLYPHLAKEWRLPSTQRHSSNGLHPRAKGGATRAPEMCDSWARSAISRHRRA